MNGKLMFPKKMSQNASNSASVASLGWRNLNNLWKTRMEDSDPKMITFYANLRAFLLINDL